MRQCWLVLTLVVALVGCDNDADKPTRTTQPSTVPQTSAPDKPTQPVASTAADEEIEDDTETVDDEPDNPHEEACAPEDPKLGPMLLLKFKWTSGIEGRAPRDKLNIARPGQRVYAHMHIRNRSGRKRCLRLTFRVGGKVRTKITLEIGKSWNWRTWAYNTIKSDDKGPLHLIGVDDQGRKLIDKMLAVVPE